MAKKSTNSIQIVGNAGLYYICYELSKRAWNVLPTSRNARGVDILIYDQNAQRKYTIQVKSLSERNPVPLGNSKDNLIADFLIVTRNVMEGIGKPECYIMTPESIKDRIHEGNNKDGKKSYWLQPKDYEEFLDNWGIIE